MKDEERARLRKQIEDGCCAKYSVICHCDEVLELLGDLKTAEAKIESLRTHLCESHHCNCDTLPVGHPDYMESL